MRTFDRFAAPWPAGAAALLIAAAPCARADVTMHEQMTFDFTILKAHGTATNSTTSDKQRRDVDLHCEGLWALLCGNQESTEIVRLDRDLSWQLDPKKKQYQESRFPTEEDRRALEQQVAKEMAAEAQRCPAQHTAPAPDTSKCDMTPPQIDVRSTDSHAMLAGHDTKLAQLALTQSCRNKETGDQCDFVIALDSWLTQDQIAGLDEQHAFQKAYLKKLGLDDENSLFQKRVRQFLAPYAGALKQLGTKSGDLKGYPLKFTVRIAFGGERCPATKDLRSSTGSGDPAQSAVGAATHAAEGATASAAGAAAGTAASNAAGNGLTGSVLGSAANAFGSKLVGNLFAKHKAAATPAAAASDASGALPPGMMQAASFTVETTSIAAQRVPSDQFDIPPGWKLVVPKPRTQKEKACPDTGT